MSPTIDHDDSTQLKEAWIWFFVFGGLEMLVGFVALGYSVLITEVSVVLFGWLLLIGGVLEVGHSLWHRRWKGFFIDLLTGLLALVVGMMVVAHPAVVAMTLTVLIAVFLLFGGLFRIAVAFAVRPQHWGWLLFNGFIAFLLGLAILQNWPFSGFWVIGFFIGINMILHGLASVMLGLSSRPPTRAIPT